MLALPFLLFVVLKRKSPPPLPPLSVSNLSPLACAVSIHYTIYRPLKYKDDGRDVVSWLDFVTIHMTFPLINAWVSYQLYYCLMITITTACSTDYLKAESTTLC